MVSLYTPPQKYLDELHEANIPDIFTPTHTLAKREGMIVRGKQQLGAVKQKLTQQMERIKADFGKKKQEEARLVLIPYEMMLKVTEDALKRVAELEQRTKAGKILPQPVTFRDLIFGTQATGEWFFGTHQDAERWEETQRLKERMIALKAERAPLLTQMEDVKAQLQEAQREVKRIEQRYKARQRGGFIVLRLLILFILALGFGAAGAFVLFVPALTFLPESSQKTLVGGVLVAVGVFLLILMPITRRNWKHGLERLRGLIQDGQAQVKAIKQEGRKIQSQFAPLDDFYKQTTAEYKEYRASFK